jgi:hypothetical protein
VPEAEYVTDLVRESICRVARNYLAVLVGSCLVDVDINRLLLPAGRIGEPCCCAAGQTSLKMIVDWDLDVRIVVINKNIGN